MHPCLLPIWCEHRVRPPKYICFCHLNPTHTCKCLVALSGVYLAASAAHIWNAPLAISAALHLSRKICASDGVGGARAIAECVGHLYPRIQRLCGWRKRRRQVYEFHDAVLGLRLEDIHGEDCGKVDRGRARLPWNIEVDGGVAESRVDRRLDHPGLIVAERQDGQDAIFDLHLLLITIVHISKHPTEMAGQVSGRK